MGFNYLNESQLQHRHELWKRYDMPTIPLQTDTCFSDRHAAKAQLPLAGYPAIHYCRGIPPIGSSYTEDAQLIFLLNGKLRMVCGSEALEMEANQMTFLRRNIWVEITRADGNDEDIQYIRFTITSDLVREFSTMADLPRSKKDEQAKMLMTSGQGWLPYVGSLEPILLENDKPQQGLIKVKMLELLFHLSRTNKYLFEQLLDIRDHFRVNITATVEDNITNSLSIEQLAVLSGRSLSSFRRDFMAIYHMPPSQWIRLKRLEKAREMLLSTTMTVTDICYTLGFEHIAHFSRLFKSHFGYAPSYFKTVSPSNLTYDRL
jgi:AraC family transcriptional regulator, exoenzyme S synthesis regulatory protein ExsA